MFRPNITRIVARREEAMESMASIRYNLLEKVFCQFISLDVELLETNEWQGVGI